MGIQQGIIKHHNQFSKKRKLSSIGKTNSLEEEFILPRVKAIEKPTPLWGWFISPTENDACRFKECSSRKIGFSLKRKFTPLNEKFAAKVNPPRKKARERHVSPLRPMFPKGGQISRRYKMMFTRDNFTSPRGRFFSSREKIANNFTSLRKKVGERHVSLVIPVFPRGRTGALREEVTWKENPMRCIIPPVVSPSQWWHVV